MWRFQQSLPFAEPGQKWVPMRRIFSVERDREGARPMRAMAARVVIVAAGARSAAHKRGRSRNAAEARGRPPRPSSRTC